MKEFYVVEDYSSCAIWDELILGELKKLPSKPKGWPRPETAGLPEGDWTLNCGMHQMATQGTYSKARIWQPTYEQLPAIFCVTDDASGAKVEVQYNVMTSAAALEFIRARI